MWFEWQQGLYNLVGKYFNSLFAAKTNPVDDDIFLDGVTPYVSSEQKRELMKEFTKEEFT